ncbi:MAG: serine hydrolase [Thermomicrobiales bacterium]
MQRTGIDWQNVARAAEQAEANGGSIGVAAIGPDGASWNRQGDRHFRAASTVKIPIMVEIYRQIDAGERSLTDPYTLTRADKAPGSGVLLHLHDGIELTLDDLLHLMISISDNTATNVLIDLAGMERVNATMRDLGMTASVLCRKMRGKPAPPGDPENWATPDDYARAIQAILGNTAASAASCGRMVEKLQRQQNARRIARYLPPDDDRVRWGSKTGTVGEVTNDVGFVTTDRGTLILAVFTAALPDTHAAELAIGEISRAALTTCGILPLDPPGASTTTTQS